MLASQPTTRALELERRVLNLGLALTAKESKPQDAEAIAHENF